MILSLKGLSFFEKMIISMFFCVPAGDPHGVIQVNSVVPKSVNQERCNLELNMCGRRGLSLLNQLKKIETCLLYQCFCVYFISKKVA